MSFVGRLATYRYLDMDVAVNEALMAARGIAEALDAGGTPPALFDDPGATSAKAQSGRR
jgi:UDP-galactopyranose mutase